MASAMAGLLAPRRVEPKVSSREPPMVEQWGVMKVLEKVAHSGAWLAGTRECWTAEKLVARTGKKKAAARAVKWVWWMADRMD